MSAPVLSVIEEFLRSAEVAHRRNAVTALVAIGSQDSIDRVVALATEDDDPRVSARAETELAELSKAANQQAALSDVLTNALEPSAGRSARVYELLGRILSAGGNPKIDSRSVWARWRLAWGMMKSYGSRRTVALRWNVFRGGFLSAAGVFVLLYLAAILTGTTLKSSAGWLWGLSSVVIGGTWASLATLIAAPLGNQYHWRTALALDLAIAAIPGGVAASIALSLYHMDFNGAGDALIWIGLAGYGPVIRLGTIAGAPILGRASGQSNRGQHVAGTCAGVVFFTVICLLVPRPFGASLWAFVLPSAAAISYAYATFDQLELPAPTRIGGGLLGKAGTALAVLLVGFCLLAIAALAMGRRSALGPVVRLDSLAAENPTVRHYRIAFLGSASLEIEVSQPMQCVADLQMDGIGAGQARRRIQFEEDSNPSSRPIVRRLEPRKVYRLVSEPSTEGEISTVLYHFRDLVTHRFDSYTLTVTLTAEN